MMLGLGDSGDITHDIGVSESSAYFALFLQDDYQASKRLTFNVGLRWDVDIPRTERHNRLDYWNPNLPSPLVGVPANACLYCANLKGQMIFAEHLRTPTGGTRGQRSGGTLDHESVLPGALTTKLWCAAATLSSSSLRNCRRVEPPAARAPMGLPVKPTSILLSIISRRLRQPLITPLLRVTTFLWG